MSWDRDAEFEGLMREISEKAKECAKANGFWAVDRAIRHDDSDWQKSLKEGEENLENGFVPVHPEARALEHCSNLLDNPATTSDLEEARKELDVAVERAEAAGSAHEEAVVAHDRSKEKIQRAHAKLAKAHARVQRAKEEFERTLPVAERTDEELAEAVTREEEVRKRVEKLEAQKKLRAPREPAPSSSLTIVQFEVENGNGEGTTYFLQRLGGHAAWRRLDYGGRRGYAKTWEQHMEHVVNAWPDPQRTLDSMKLVVGKGI